MAGLEERPVPALAAAIPLSARILTVADVYDVLTSQRPYKEPLSEEVARERIMLGSATSFDPTIVEAFLHLLDTYPNFTLPQHVCPLPQKNKPASYFLVS